LSASRPCCVTLGEIAPPPLPTHWIVGWVDPRVGLDELKKRKFLTLRELELRLLGRPTRSQSSYRLHYPGSFVNMMANNFICRGSLEGTTCHARRQLDMLSLFFTDVTSTYFDLIRGAVKKFPERWYSTLMVGHTATLN
jgi:hypothetical protein